MEAELVEKMPNGCAIYRQPNSVGGYTYFSDEIGGGVVVWDTALVNESTLLRAIALEHERSSEEQRAAREAE